MALPQTSPAPVKRSGAPVPAEWHIRDGTSDEGGARGQKLVNDARAPYTARVPMTGLTGRLTVAVTLTQAGSGNVVLAKKSRRC